MLFGLRIVLAQALPGAGKTTCLPLAPEKEPAQERLMQGLCDSTSACCCEVGSVSVLGNVRDISRVRGWLQGEGRRESGASTEVIFMTAGIFVQNRPARDLFECSGHFG